MQQIGNYTVLGVLGEGGMATVYEAEDRTSGRRVALKVLEAGIGASPRVRQLFEAEMAILDRIQHPNVVRLLTSLEVDGQLVMVLERLHGQTLRALLAAQGRLPWQQAAAYLQQVLAGLSAAHAQLPPVVHRDLKPENVMVTPDGAVKVMDFGIAKVIREGTMATTDVGTLQYMCPEQIDGYQIDHRADLYNAGLVLYEMLTGAPPFNSPSTRELLNAQCFAPPPPLAPELAAAVPASLVELMHQMLAKAATGRPESAGAVQMRLEAISRDPGPAASTRPAAPSLATVHPVTGPGAPPSKTTGSGSTGVVVAAIAGLVLVLGIGGAWFALGSGGDDDADGGDTPKKPTKVAQAGADEPPGAETPPAKAPAKASPEPSPEAAAPTTKEVAPIPKEVEPVAEVAEPDPTPAAAAAEEDPLEVEAVACEIEGRTEGVDDLAVLAKRDEPTLAWIDGSTGEAYRTKAIDENEVHCVAPHILGVTRDKGSKLELIEVASGDVALTVEIAGGLRSLGRKDARLSVVDRKKKHEVTIPGCAPGQCVSTHPNVWAARVVDGFGNHGPQLCPTFGIGKADPAYSATQTAGKVTVTATRGRKRAWSTSVDAPSGTNLQLCGLAASDDTVGILRGRMADEQELVTLRATDGTVDETNTVDVFINLHNSVQAFVHNGKYFVMYVVGRDELIAFEDTGKIAWRR